jgi:hypothetical protein
MKQSELEDIAAAVASAIKATVDPLKRQIAELQSRQSIQAAKAYVNFRGTFMPGTMYHKGDAATRSGGLWIALEDTAAVPGGATSESRAWQLAVKKGDCDD